MRTLKLAFLTAVLSLSLGACGSDGDGGGTADAAAVVIDSAGGASPVISAVAWTHTAPCVASTPSDVDVVVTVTDADSAAGTLVVTGNVASCTGALDALTSTISCPQAAPYTGTVTVTDPENNSDTMTFTIAVCTDGTAP